jgi:uncharacterized repeat protein (TIGR01451 family)
MNVFASRTGSGIRKLSLFILMLSSLLIAQFAFAQDPDLPGAPQNLQTIPTGSLIIPMDTLNQQDGAGLFNLKAYGAVNNLLQNEIPVLWAIRSDKTKIVGTATADNAAGTTLTDSTATFLTDGVQVGDIVTNVGNKDRAGAFGIVSNVTETVLTLNPPLSGAPKDDEWKNGDGYVIDQNDFTVEASRALPSVVSEVDINFASGPFIVLASNAADALTKLAGFGNGVAVFVTTEEVDVDVRYTLTQKPFVAISEVNTKIHAAVMDAAGIPGAAIVGKDKDYTNCPAPGEPGHDPFTCNWNVVPPELLEFNDCITLHMEPHREDKDSADQTLHQAKVLAFVQAGGNFMAQCHAVRNFEGDFDTSPDQGIFLTTKGVVDADIDQILKYPNPPLPFSQITGSLDGGQGGSLQDWTLGTGALKNDGYINAVNSINTDRYQAIAGKLNSGAGAGGNVFFLGGHDYKDDNNSSINGQRMALNTVFVPADRPAECGFDFGEPSMSVEKTSTTAGPFAAGQTITYNIKVTNTGPVQLTGVTVDDDLTGTTDAQCGTGTLAPGADCTVQVQYQVTQNDIDTNGGGDGDIDNIGTGDSNETDPVDDPYSVPLVAQNPSMSVEKTSTTPGPFGLNDTITYNIKVTNNGNVTLTGVTVDDDLTSTTDAQCGTGTLAPGADCTVQVQYQVTQNDIDTNGGGDGDIDNTGTGDSNETDPVDDPYSVPLVQQSAALGITKTARSQGPYTVGQTVTYDIVVQNNGNVTLSGVIINDALTNTVNATCTPNGGTAGVLLVGQSCTVVGTYLVTQTDVNNKGNNSADGLMHNTAYADSIQTTEVNDSETVPLVYNPSMIVTKEATTPGPFGLNDEITYNIKVTNNGNVTLTGVTVDDDLTGTTDEVCGSGTLLPTADCTVQVKYTVTQNDIDTNGGGDGDIDNTGTGDSNETDPVDADESVPIVYTPLLGLTKTADPIFYDVLNESITYSYKLVNLGNVTLHKPFTVADNKATVSCAGEPDTLAPGTPPPGEDFTCTATYNITQGDLDAGFVTNIATGTARRTSGCELDNVPCRVNSNQRSATINRIGLNLAKTSIPATYSGGSTFTVVYTITATNNGPDDEDADLTYDIDDVFSPGAGISLITASIKYGSGPNGPDGNATAVNSPLVANGKFVDDAILQGDSSETWIITAKFGIAPGSLTVIGSDCETDDADGDDTGFYNTVSGSASDTDLTDNSTCEALPIIDLAKTAGPPVEQQNGTYKVEYTVTATNYGAVDGFYDIVDALAPANGLTLAAPAPAIAYVGGNDSQDTTPPYVYPNFVTGEGLGAGNSETWTVTAYFNVEEGADLTDAETCDEADPQRLEGFYNLVTGSSTDNNPDNNDTCSSLVLERYTQIRVQKIFTDGNDETGVTLTLWCSSGNWSPVTVTVYPDSTSPESLWEHIFIVSKLPLSQDGERCTVTEVPVPGYTAYYTCPQENADSVSDPSCIPANPQDPTSVPADNTVCEWSGVFSGDINECFIYNMPDPVEVEVTKVWDVTNAGGDYFSRDAEITVICDAEMYPSDGKKKGNWYLNTYIKDNMYINDQYTVTVEVIPDYPSSYCYALEDHVNSAVVVTNGCGEYDKTLHEVVGGMEVSVGQGGSCTITNTLFFEGIPTLNQWGMAIMALLMLGVGLVGFRRFV